MVNRYIGIHVPRDMGKIVHFLITLITRNWKQLKYPSIVK